MGLTRRPGRKTQRGATTTNSAVQKATFDAARKKEVGVSDLTLLSKVSDEAILDNLKLRFENGLIYTYIGHVLISVNPFRDLGIYTDAVLESYKGKNRLEMPPHVYAIAESMYYNMKSYDENQCVIISGESGAGKTEAAKRIMQYISSASGQSTSAISRIKDMVLATNPLLESFGCAKTLRNDNSSRHGKYLEILFNGQSEPVGAHITNYLLEKNRVVGQLKGERNFHIFYQFAKGAPQKWRDQFGIQQPEAYAYTRGTTQLAGVDDPSELQTTLQVMDVIGLSETEKENIFRILAAILWIGNIDFIEADDSTTTIADASVTAYAAYLLGVQGPDLEKALTTKLVESRAAGSFESPLNRTQASATRDTLAKAIYNNLFEWIVDRVNESLVTLGESTKSIGILDIYGFEIFDHNSFEQICINYVNEKLQQIFIQLTLKTEQDEYISEQIAWTPIDYFNNKVVCDLIEELRPPGVFAALNDACATAHADSGAADQSFAMKLQALDNNAYLQMRSNMFIVKHYAGDVQYDISQMTDKNKDQISLSLSRMLASTQDQYLQVLFPPQPEDSGSGRRRRATASDKIKLSANALMDTLARARPSYIRTIKPNQNRSPSEFDSHAVLHQVKYLGLKENVRIRRAGFAYRAPFEKFVERFYLLSPKTGYAGDYVWEGATRDAAVEIMKSAMIPKEEWQLGTTKVFIKTPETLFALEHMRDMYWHNMASRIQRACRHYLARREEAAETLQRAVRLFLGISAEPSYPPPDDAYLNGRKERRRFSLLGDRAGYGDYLACNDRQGSSGGYLVQSVGIREPVIFSARGEQLFSKLGRSALRLTRTFILTDSTFYTVRGELQQGRLVYVIERTVLLRSISSLQMSSLRDDWFAVCTASRDTSDLLLNCVFKTELVGLLSKGSGKAVTIGPSINYAKKPGKNSIVKFARDSSVGMFDVYKSGTVHVGTGLPGSSPHEAVPKPLGRSAKSGTGAAPTPRPRPVPTPAAAAAAAKPAAPRSRGIPLVSPDHLQTHGNPPSLAARVGPIEASHHSATNGNANQSSYEAPPSHQASQQNGYTSNVTAPAAPPPPPPPPPAQKSAKALYAFPGGNAGELPLQVGQIIAVEQDSGNGWTLGRSDNGQSGWVPTSYIEAIGNAAPNMAQGLASALNQQQAQGQQMANELANAIRGL